MVQLSTRVHYRTVRKASVVLAVVILSALLGPPPASAARVVTITGGGWGHGIGMSQYGAYGRAKNGRNATAILEHYYKGARVRTKPMPARIRVGLLQGRSRISVSSSAFKSGGGTVGFKVKGQKGLIAKGGPGVTWRVEPSPAGGFRLFRDGVRVRHDGRSAFGSASRHLVLIYARFGSLARVVEKSNNYAYGKMQFRTYSGCGGHCLNLVVALGMQRYLYGLGEVPSSWPRAALRAQAIAGRTYAFEKVKRLGQNRYPCSCAVYDSVIDQAYIGDSKRTGSGTYWSAWKSAVDATNGQVVLHKGAPIQALYSSSSGGYTENNENVWGGAPIAYLRGVGDKPDNNSANPNHKWKVEMSWSTFSSKLNATYRTGPLKRFRLIKPFGVSGRVTVVKADGTGGVRIVGENRTVRASGWSIRSALSLKDTLFRVSVTYTAAAALASEHESLDAVPGGGTGPAYSVPLGADETLGRAQDFEVGRMTLNRERDAVVWQYGPVLERYDAAGRESSALGMPVSGIWERKAYSGASYENGIIAWTEAGGARVVVGDFYDAYRRVKGMRGPLGRPVSERIRAAASLPAGGALQRFEDGTLYRAPGRRPVALWGSIDRRYRTSGAASSACGYPLTDASGGTAAFENGTIAETSSGTVVSCG